MMIITCNLAMSDEQFLKKHFSTIHTSYYMLEKITNEQQNGTSSYKAKTVTEFNFK